MYNPFDENNTTNNAKDNEPLEQDTAKEVMTFFTKVKNFFWGKKNVSGKNIPEGEGKDVLLLEFEPINN